MLNDQLYWIYQSSTPIEASSAESVGEPRRFGQLDSGQWVPETRPEELSKLLANFFKGH